MKDLFDSNGYLPLHYKIRREDCIPGAELRPGPDGKLPKPIRDSLDIMPFKSIRYQTNKLIHTGIPKPISNLHN